MCAWSTWFKNWFVWSKITAFCLFWAESASIWGNKFDDSVCNCFAELLCKDYTVYFGIVSTWNALCSETATTGFSASRGLYSIDWLTLCSGVGFGVVLAKFAKSSKSFELCDILFPLLFFSTLSSTFWDLSKFWEKSKLPKALSLPFLAYPSSLWMASFIWLVRAEGILPLLLLIKEIKT